MEQKWGDEKHQLLHLLLMTTGQLWLSATRQVEVTSASEKGVANRQNDWVRSSKSLKLSQNPTKLEEHQGSQ